MSAENKTPPYPYLHSLLNWTSHWYSWPHMQHMWQIKGLVRIQFSLIANVSANFILIAFIPEMSTWKKKKKKFSRTNFNPRPRDKWTTLSHPGHYSCLIQPVTRDVVSSVKLDWKNKSGEVAFPRIHSCRHVRSHPCMCCFRSSVPPLPLCSSHWRLSDMYKGSWLFHYTPHLLPKIVLDCLTPPGFSSLLDPK